MLWNNLVCPDCLSLKSLLWKVCGLKLDSSNFDFIKFLAQIINNFSKVQPNKTK